MANDLPEFSPEAVSRAVQRFRNTSEMDSLGDGDLPAHVDGRVIELMTRLEMAGFIAPFDWHKWVESELGPGWNTDISLVENADLETLRRLLIAHQRLERVHRNHLDTAFRSGYMDALFNRLSNILEG